MDIIFPKFERFTTKLIFYRIPKNASTSIYNHLGDFNVIKLNEEAVLKKTDQKIYRNTLDPSHLKPKELKDLILGEGIRDFFSFCVVRNPWDRALSMYKHAILNDIKYAYGISEEDSFDAFCSILKERKDDPFFIASHKQSDWAFGGDEPSKILRFENLNHDYSEMLQEINIVGINPSIPHLNKTEHEHYSNYYNDNTKKIISEVYEKDIDNFKYTFDKETKFKKDKEEGRLRI